MKFGMCTSIAMLEKALECGADFIEVNNSPLCKMSDEEFEKNLEIAKKFPGTILATNGFFPPEIALTGENQSEEIRPWVEKSVDRLSQLGVKNIVFGSGKARNCPEGFPMEKALEQVFEVACMIADIAKPYGINLTIEPLRKEESNMIHTAADSCNMARRSGRDNFRGHVDFYHFMQGGEKLRDLIPHIDILSHVHIASPVLRKEPTADDCADYKAFLDALRSGGYDGGISLEGGFSKDWNDVAEYFRYIKSL